MFDRGEVGDGWDAFPARTAYEGVAATVAAPPAGEPGWGASLAGQPAQVSPEVAALEDAVIAAAVRPAGELPPDTALANTEALLGVLEQVRLLVLDHVSDMETRHLHRLAAAPTTPSWLREHGSPLSGTDVALARRLPSLPTVAGSVHARRITTAVAARIGTALTKLRRWVDQPDGLIDGQPAAEALEGVILHGVRDQVCTALGGLADDDPRLPALVTGLAEIHDRPVSELARLEAAFVLLAEQIEPALVPSALGMLVDALLPNELERKAAAGHDERGFDVKLDPDGDRWRVTDGELDLELGELLHAVLTAEMATDPANAADTDAYRAARAAGWTDVDGAEGLLGPTTGNAVPRSRRQRQHDALKSALRRLLDGGALGARDKVAPHIGVTVGADALDGRPGAAPAVGASGARLPRTLVMTWACDSALTRFVLSLGRKAIEASHTERTLKPHERRAKRVETGGRCQAAGCRCGPRDKLIPHHGDPWARTRTTSLADTVLLCEYSHYLLHSGDVLRLRDGRRVGPGGWVG